MLSRAIETIGGALIANRHLLRWMLDTTISMVPSVVSRYILSPERRDNTQNPCPLRVDIFCRPVYNADMTKISDTVCSLWSAGYSVDFIASHLGISGLAVRRYIPFAPRLEAPYLTIRQAAATVGTSYDAIYEAIRHDGLRCVFYRGVCYTTAEWIDLWLRRQQYAQQAEKLLALW